MSADVAACDLFHHGPGLCAQDFIDCRDVMPSISLENNVIHNNEGYGVIIVKPNNHEERRVSQDASEGTWSSVCHDKRVHGELSPRYLQSSSNCALNHQSLSRSALHQRTMSPNQQRRKTARRAALPPPRGRSGSLTVS